jgi:lipoprotein-anchoring transpeptidase ErfK/SrfK
MDGREECRLQNAECRMQNAGFRVQKEECRMGMEKVSDMVRRRCRMSAIIPLSTTALFLFPVSLSPQATAPVQLIVSVGDRTLTVVRGQDTLFRGPVGVASGVAFTYAGHSWAFHAPRGTWRVLRKVTDPVWTPPDWHYAETARNYGLRLSRLAQTGTTLLSGARLAIRDSAVGIVLPGEEFAELPIDEHIVFDGQLFIPPIWTRNRRVTGDLGRYALDLGSGYMIHGTPNTESIGRASTHGCIRVGDDDLAWLYENVPVGARVVFR